MATIAPERPGAAGSAPPRRRRSLKRYEFAGSSCSGWIALYIPLKGRNTLALAPADLSRCTRSYTT